MSGEPSGRARVARPGREPPKAKAAPPAAAAERERAGGGTAAEHDSERPAHDFADVRVHGDDLLRGVPGAGPLADEPGQPLDRGVGQQVGAAFRQDFSAVRVHHGTPGARIAGERGARAVAIGQHVAFAPGEYRPGSIAGNALIAHELAHVAQQDGATSAQASAAGPVEADAERATTGALLATFGPDPTAAEAPSLRTGLSLRSCNGGGKNSGFESAVKTGDFAAAAALIAAEADDDVILRKLKKLTPDELGKLDAEALKLPVTAVQRIHRLISFTANNPAVKGVASNVTVDDAGTVGATDKVPGGTVEARKDAKITLPDASKRTSVFSASYSGTDSGKSRFLQFIWREMIVEHPVKGTFAVSGPLASTAKTGYAWTTDPKKPNYNTDTTSSTNPFYEAGGAHNRTAGATTIFDRPASRIGDAKTQFDAGATKVTSRAHFTTYLVRDMKILYVIKTDVEWVFANGTTDPTPTITQSGAAATALDPEIRKVLISQVPKADFLP